MGNILEIKGLTKNFSGLVAVDGLNLNMQSRTIHSLIGPNGSGKTTTINMIHGTFPASSGQIFFDGKEITNLQTYKIARAGMGRTFQNIKLFNTLTVLENAMVGGHQTRINTNILQFIFDIKRSNQEEKELRDKAYEMLKFVGLTELANQKVGNLSYGRQKMTELARALMVDPKLILLDEPAAGLNPSERAEFVDILEKTFDSGIDLFLIEHNMDVVMKISDRITVLNFGRKIAEGTPTEIQNNDEVITAYLGKKYKKTGGDNHA